MRADSTDVSTIMGTKVRSFLRSDDNFEIKYPTKVFRALLKMSVPSLKKVKYYN